MRDPGLLACGLVGNSFAANTHSQLPERKALLMAAVLEALFLAALLLIPIITAGKMPRRVNLAPLPLSFGEQGGTRAARQQAHSTKHQSPPRKLIPVPTYLPPPSRIHAWSDDSASPTQLTGPMRPGVGPGGGDVPGIPDGTGDRNRLPFVAVALAKEPLPPAVRRISSVEPAALVHRVDPVYPVSLRQIGLEGTVRLHAIIGTDGTIRELTAESGHPLFVQAALEAVRQWRYKPTSLNGQAVEVETTITVVFELAR